MHELDVQGVEGDEAARKKREIDDPTRSVHPMRKFDEASLLLTDHVASLKLKVYRSLGIDVEADGAGNHNKVVIRNNRKGNVHVVDIDPKFSTFFYSNYFWQTIQ